MEGEVVEECGVIQALDKNVVHRICTGQVILSLSAACKELVENALDAGATVIEIRAKDHGLTNLEVIDNGIGVKEENFRSLGQAHCTSKLAEFSDLANLSTFGFRGEALNALMSLSNLTIVTRHGESQIAHKLEYDHEGRLTKKLSCARQIGTTVNVSNFFEPLPVRRKEFEKNAKKEFTKLTNMIYAYCLISTKVRFEFVHTLNGKKQTVVATHGNATVKENLCNVFGSKQIEVLHEFQPSEPKEDVLMAYNLTLDDVKMDFFRIEGFVSGVQRSDGRCNAERQYIFINGRPCDYQKICRVINEVYHEYNRQQYPFVLLNICSNSDAIDVNVTPDKRSIYVSNENFLFALLKSSLRVMFNRTAGTYDLVDQSSSNAVQKSTQKRSQTSDLNSQPNTKQSKITDQFRSFLSSSTKNADVDALSECSSERDSLKLNSSTGRCESRGTISSLEDDHVEQQQSTSFALHFHQRNSVVDDAPVDSVQMNTDIQPIKPLRGVYKNPFDREDNLDPLDGAEISSTHRYAVTSPIGETIDVPINGSHTMSEFLSKSMLSCPPDQDSIPTATTKYIIEKASNGVLRRSAQVSFNFQVLKQRIAEIEAEDVEQRTDSEEFHREFRARIVPGENKDAENELKRCIKKEMFKSMSVVGQFNRGFIVVRCSNDLFIVDQHATDEKYNFEILQQNYVVQSQRLIQPTLLELTTSNENIVFDNIEVFRKNGFDFELSDTDPKLKLTAVPVFQKNTSGKQDIDDIIFMLADFPGQMYRPPRLYDMFAMKACRKSVMIGTTLSKDHMQRIVSHMADIDQPWNCPHGRPTMRHLFNLKMLPDY